MKPMIAVYYDHTYYNYDVPIELNDQLETLMGIYNAFKNNRI